MPAKGRLPIKREKVDTYVADLRRWAAKLAEISRQMAEHEIEKIEVMNTPAAEAGLVGFERLVQSCEREVAKVKRERENGSL